MNSPSAARGVRSQTLIWLLAAGAYCLCFAAYQSHYRLMLLDELFAWNLVDDPSWHHALHAWNHGVDGGGLFFYASLWPLERGSDGSVLLARLTSAAEYCLAGVMWWRCLSRFIEERWAALGVLVVWVSSELLLGYVYMIRFYALYLLLAALAVYVFLKAAEGTWSRGVSAWAIFAVNACLVLTHMIGILYSGLVLGAWMLCVRSRRGLWILGLPVVAGWATLILCRTAIHYSALNYGYPGMPHPRDFLRFYVKSAITFPVLLLAAIGLGCLLLHVWQAFREDWDTTRMEILGPVLCAVYLLSPLGLYAICLLSKPIAAVRYLLPYYLSLATLCAYALQWIALQMKLRDAPLKRIAAGALAMGLLVLHWVAIRHLAPAPSFDLAAMRQHADGNPMLVRDEESFFQLQHYFSTPRQQFYFVTAPRGSFGGLMATVAAQGYYPGHIVSVDQFLSQHTSFDLLRDPVHPPPSWYPGPARCEVAPLGPVQVGVFVDQLEHIQACR